MQIVSNTTPFIALASVDLLGLLPAIYSSIIVPEAVLEELRVGGPIKVPDISKYDWINIVPNNIGPIDQYLFQLDYGERQAIIHSLEIDADLVLLDDAKARNIAEYFGIKVKGTLGVLVEAKKQNKITSFRNTALSMRKKNIRFSLKLINAISESLREK